MFRVKENSHNKNAQPLIPKAEEEKQTPNPRDGCCWKGKYFFDALKAIVTRMLFSLHAFLAIWQVTIITNRIYWWLTISFLGILIETLYVLFKRRGQEWKWFQVSIFLYVCATLPPIWILELTKLGRWRAVLNSTAFSTNVVNNGEIGAVTVNLTNQEWTIILEQGLVLLIIMGRWLMPKGDLTRDQLSALLLYHLGTASDIVDFLSILSEPHIVRTGTFLYAVLIVWSWSLFQFPFVVTSTSGSSNSEDEEPVYDYSKVPSIDSRDQLGLARQFFRQKIDFLEAFLETEMWGIFVSVLMQDGPFAIMRIISIAAFRIVTYTNYFFTGKNVLVLFLQLYRLIALYVESKEAKLKARESMKRVKLSSLYDDAFVDYKENILEKEKCTN